MTEVDGAIVTTTTNNNYGNVVQRYALQAFLRKNGYNFISYYFYGFYWRVYFIKVSCIFHPFRNAYRLIKGKKTVKRTASIYNYSKLSKFCRQRINQKLFIPFVQKKYSRYIIGSDQNLNDMVITREFFVKWTNFWLGFVKWNALRISYASSFGRDDFEKKSVIKSNEAKRLIQKFDAFSVREEFGIDLAKRFWDIEAEEVLDPTLLLSKHDYDMLIDNPVCDLVATKPIFYYLLHQKEDSPQVKLLQRLSKEQDLEFDGSAGSRDISLMPVEQWLKGFRDSNLVITNSFHGTIFAIINHTDFITLGSNTHKNAGRYVNLLKKVGLTDRIIWEKDFHDFDIEHLKSIEWSTVDRKLNKLKKHSGDWLLTSLNKE